MGPRGRATGRLHALTAHLVAGKKNKKKEPLKRAVPPEELLASVQGEWEDQHGTTIEIVEDEAIVHQRGQPKRWTISIRGNTLYFGGSILAIPHDVVGTQAIPTTS